MFTTLSCGNEYFCPKILSMPKTFTSCVDCTNSNCMIRMSNTVEVLLLIDQHKVMTRVNKNQVFFRERNHAFNVFFIYEGLFRVFKHGPMEKDQTVRYSMNRDILGHRGLISSAFYPVSAESIQDSIVCSFSREYFFELLESNAKIAVQVMLFFANELHDEETKLRNLAVFNVREKVAYALLMMIDRFGMDENGIIHKSELMSRKDLSELVGLNQNQVTKVLADFRDEDLIESVNKHIHVKNLNGLQAMIAYCN